MVAPVSFAHRLLSIYVLNFHGLETTLSCLINYKKKRADREPFALVFQQLF